MISCCHHAYLNNLIFMNILSTHLFETKLKYLLFAIISLLTCLFLPAIIQSDTVSYFNIAPSRAIFYPLFLKIIQLFSEDLRVIIFIQSFFGLFSSFYLTKNIVKNFELDNKVSYFFLFLILPVILKISTHILSESLTLSFYFLFTAFLLKFLRKKDLYLLIFSLFFLFVGILIRTQLIFAILSVLIIICLSTIFFKEKIKVLVISLICLLFCLFVPNLINKVWNYKNHGVFFSGWDTAGQLLYLPLFMSDENILKFINDTDQKIIISKTINCLRKNNVNYEYAIKNNLISFQWIKLFWGSYPIFRFSCNRDIIEELKDFQNFAEQEKFERILYFNLIEAHFKSNPKKLFKGYWNNFSEIGFYNKYLCIYFIIFLFMMLIFQLRFYNLKLITLNFFLLSHFINVSEITLIEPVLFRYKVYTELPLILIFLSLIFNLCVDFKKSKN